MKAEVNREAPGDKRFLSGDPGLTTAFFDARAGRRNSVLNRLLRVFRDCTTGGNPTQRRPIVLKPNARGINHARNQSSFETDPPRHMSHPSRLNPLFLPRAEGAGCSAHPQVTNVKPASWGEVKLADVNVTFVTETEIRTTVFPATYVVNQDRARSTTGGGDYGIRLGTSARSSR